LRALETPKSPIFILESSLEVSNKIFSGFKSLMRLGYFILTKTPTYALFREDVNSSHLAESDT